MTRMFSSLAIACLLVGFTWANDPEILPPGHKPFHSPKAPQPNGAFATNACFGYHATRWTPWNAACGNCNAAGQPIAPQCQCQPVGTSCTTSAIILFDEAPATTAAPTRGAVMPAPESSTTAKPMPPAKK